MQFQFGENWRHYLSVLDDERIAEAERSLRVMLGTSNLKSRSFVDIGSGSGLFSLAAKRLGADHVHSFDFDAQSVSCAEELKRRYYPEDSDWTIERGDVLDSDYVASLGHFDVTYSWGVLHHTGHMWRGLDNAIRLVGRSGSFFVSIYNDQGRTSHRWRRIKRQYNRSHFIGKYALVAGVGSYLGVRAMVSRLLRGEVPKPLAMVRRYKVNRGMSYWHDLVDWVGGYPFEVATPAEVIEFCTERQLALEKSVTCGTGHGCNQFVFTRTES